MEDGKYYMILFLLFTTEALTVSSAIFQAGGLIVVVVEVTRKAYLASLVPVIVDSILNEHQVVADIVAFVSHGDFPRSRLGEKQRGKVLASWVTRKLRTIAQFSIRDMEGTDPFGEMPQHRSSRRSSKPDSIMGNSLRRSTLNPENDAPAVPRSPAPVVLEERIEAPPSAYQDKPVPALPQELDVPTDNAVAATPVPEPTSAVPHIQEPQSATIVSEYDDHPHMLEPVNAHDVSPVSPVSPANDFRFSFDIINTPMDHQSQEPVSPIDLPSTGRNSLPSRQPWRYSSAPGMANTTQDEKPRPGTQESGLIDDWPQEALMYQSTLGAEDSQGVHRTLSSTSAAARKRYDGSGYDS